MHCADVRKELRTNPTTATARNPGHYMSFCTSQARGYSASKADPQVLGCSTIDFLCGTNHREILHVCSQTQWQFQVDVKC